jgi:hypothetical protein
VQHPDQFYFSQTWFAPHKLFDFIGQRHFEFDPNRAEALSPNARHGGDDDRDKQLPRDLGGDVAPRALRNKSWRLQACKLIA